MTFMTHPEHGATNTQNVEEHEANGWKVSTHEEWLGAKARKADPAEEAPPVEFEPMAPAIPAETKVKPVAARVTPAAKHGKKK